MSGGVISTSSFAKALWPGINSWYGKAYNDHATEWDKLFDTFSSKRAYEEDVGVTGLGLAAVKPQGQGVTYDSDSQAYITRYQHVVYALGFVITREMVEDDLYDVVGSRRAKGLARSMRHTKEIVAANVYNRAFNSAYTGGDGVELCATNHPRFAGGANWANELATAADLSQTALEQAYIDIGKWTDDRGLRIAVRPTKLIIPVDLEFEAMRILKSAYEPGGSQNDINPMYGRFDPIINHFLTDTDAWFLRTNVGDGMKCFTRRGMQFGMDNDFDTENAKYKATERYSFGWTDPRAIFGSPGAG